MFWACLILLLGCRIFFKKRQPIAMGMFLYLFIYYIGKQSCPPHFSRDWLDHRAEILHAARG